MTNKTDFQNRLSRIGAKHDQQKPRNPLPPKPSGGGAWVKWLPVPLNLALLGGLLLVFDNKLTEMGFDEVTRCEVKQGTHLSDKYRASMGLPTQSDC